MSGFASTDPVQRAAPDLIGCSKKLIVARRLSEDSTAIQDTFKWGGLSRAHPFISALRSTVLQLRETCCLKHKLRSTNCVSQSCSRPAAITWMAERSAMLGTNCIFVWRDRIFAFALPQCIYFSLGTAHQPTEVSVSRFTARSRGSNGNSSSPSVCRHPGGRLSLLAWGAPGRLCGRGRVLRRLWLSHNGSPHS